MIRKGLEGKSHRLRALQEIFEEGYVKIKKKEEKRKSGMEGGCLSILRGAKEVSMEERHNKCQKSTPKKSSFMSFGASRIKPLVSSKVFRSIIHHRKSWIYIMTYVKRILIFEINKVICHFLHNDNEKES